MEDVFNTLNFLDDNDIFRGYTTMIELYNALKFITMLIFIQKIFTFNLGVAFLKSVSNYNLLKKTKKQTKKHRIQSQLSPVSKAAYA